MTDQPQPGDRLPLTPTDVDNAIYTAADELILEVLDLLEPTTPDTLDAVAVALEVAAIDLKQTARHRRDPVNAPAPIAWRAPASRRHGPSSGR